MRASRLGGIALLAAALAAVPLAAAAQDGRGPRTNDQFPPKGHLSPPNVDAVDACSLHVHVSGFVPKATVRLFKNGVSLIGTATPKFGFVTFTVPALTFGDKLSATQTVLGDTSAPTNPPAIVGKAPTSLNAPTIDKVIYACGRIVPVHNLVSGVTVDVREVESASSIGGGFTPNDWGTDWTPAFTTPLVAAHHVTATQASCSPIVSPPSAPVPVLAEPMPLLAPTLDPPVLGNDAVTAHGLYTGALLEVFDHATPDGSGYATGANNWTGLNSPIGGGSLISARQSLCHHSPPSKPQPPVKTLPAPIVLAPICPKQHFAKIRGTVIDANVVLFRNGAIAGYGGAGPGDVTLNFAPPNVAANGDAFTALQYIGAVVSPISAPVIVNCFKQNVVTQHNDNARHGAQLAETILTPANVSGPSFGLLYDRAVLGTILAQPLYVHGVKTGMGPAGPIFKNLVYVATSQDVVYAFDADDTSPDTVSGGESTKAIWRRPVGTPHVGDICGETDPPIVGVTSTPVIDVGAGRMYVVARDQHGLGGLGVDVLHALDIATGADLKSAVVKADVPISRDTTLHFNAACQRQRPGLLLQNGNVYLGYGTYQCDQPCPNGDPYRGWIIGYHANDLTPAGAFVNSLAPDEAGMGVWASGNGLAGNDDGSAIFYQTGNDIGGSGVLHNGDAFIKLTSTANSLAFAARFQPANANDLRAGDTDLGSGGPMLLPGGRLVGGGKDGAFYVLPQSNLTSGATGFQAFFNSFHVGPTPYPYNAPPVYPTQCPLDPPVGHVANADQHCWIDTALYPKGEAYGPNIHGGPIYWATDATHGLVYKMPEKDYLKAFAYDAGSGTLNPVLAVVATIRPAHDGMPGGFSSLSANNATNGIVWTVVQQLDGQWGPATNAILYAFDAKTLHVLWNNAGVDEAAFAKFNSPTIADGRVFLPSVGHFQVYGLAPATGRIHWREPLRGLPLGEAIRRRWQFTGGAAGTLGAPLAKELVLTRDALAGGAHVDFVQDVVAGGYGNISVPANVRIVIPMCNHPETQKKMRIVSSIYATPKTGARIVRGEIRRVFLAQGGVKRFGYPVTDEVPTPDGFGLMTSFERGTLVWYPGKEVRVAGPTTNVAPRRSGNR
jgi:outer membrane protein assembly factor BamB